jgi:hypothetical protein
MSNEQILTAGPMRVVFAHHGDRFVHAIEVFDGSGWYGVYRSVEGTADEPWPASPPLVQLHVEQRPGGRQVALLVGMAGGNHWSAGVEADPGLAKISFDIACRARAEVIGSLGSTYEQLPTGGKVSRPTITVGNDDTARIAPGRLSVGPTADSSPGPRTVRWAYQWSVNAPPGSP